MTNDAQGASPSLSFLSWRRHTVVHGVAGAVLGFLGGNGGAESLRMGLVLLYYTPTEEG